MNRHLGIVDPKAQQPLSHAHQQPSSVLQERKKPSKELVKDTRVTMKRSLEGAEEHSKKRPSRKKTGKKVADEPPPAAAAAAAAASEDAKKSTASEVEEFTAEELSKMSRSERKRHREKKRRNDVNKGFEDLMNLLLEIDPSVRSEAEERSKRGQFKSGTPNAAAAGSSAPAQAEENLLSRVDLITKTTEVLRRVHRENEDRKTIIEQLLRKTNERQSTDPDGAVTLRSANGGIVMANNPKKTVPNMTNQALAAAAMAGGSKPNGGGASAAAAALQASLNPSFLLQNAALQQQLNQQFPQGLPQGFGGSHASAAALDSALLQAAILRSQASEQQFAAAGGNMSSPRAGSGQTGGNHAGIPPDFNNLLTTRTLLQQQLLDSNMASAAANSAAGNPMNSALLANTLDLQQQQIQRQRQQSQLQSQQPQQNPSALNQDLIEQLLRRNAGGGGASGNFPY